MLTITIDFIIYNYHINILYNFIVLYEYIKYYKINAITYCSMRLATMTVLYTVHIHHSRHHYLVEIMPVFIINLLLLFFNLLVSGHKFIRKYVILPLETIKIERSIGYYN